MLIKFKKKLSGDRILLKINIFDLELSQKIFQAVDENREYLSKWLPWASLTKKVEDTLEFLLETEEGIKKGKKVNYGI